MDMRTLLELGKAQSCFLHELFLGIPEQYTHIAGHHQRRIVLTFTGDEIEDYNRLIELVGEAKAEETIKELIRKYLTPIGR